jgi:crotonobetainyl-CoA:carnitine CoA-transferase CaiB-like acyl-CoA transferase
MRAFDGIRVLDLTHVLAGPFSTYQLAVLGADVIKIESPTRPDMVRAVGADPDSNAIGMGGDFQTQAANKRSMTLDLSTPEGAGIFLELVRTVDVVVDNYQAGSMERLGLGWERLLEINPRLISCSVTGFGHDGPKAGRPSYDAVIKAASGFLAAQHRSLRATEMVVGPSIFDYATGAMAAFAISSALFRRERTGVGQRLDVSMLDAALMLLSVDITNLFAGNEQPGPEKWANQGHPGYRLYDTADGTLMAGAWTGEQTANFWTVLGQPERALDARYRSISDLESADLSVINEVQVLMLEKTADEWEALLNAAEVPASRVRNLAEAVADPQVGIRGTLHTFPGGMTHTVAPFTSPVDGPEVHSPAPALGQHTADILRELGKSDDEIALMHARGVI